MVEYPTILPFDTLPQFIYYVPVSILTRYVLWLGHVSLDTTHIYAEVDLEMKAKALAQCDIPESATAAEHWSNNPELVAFLKSL